MNRFLTAAVVTGKDASGVPVVKLAHDSYRDHPIVLSDPYPLVPNAYKPSGDSYAFVPVPDGAPGGQLPQTEVGDIIFTMDGRGWPVGKECGLLIDENCGVLKGGAGEGQVDSDVAIKAVHSLLRKMAAENSDGNEPCLLTPGDLNFGAWVEEHRNEPDEALVAVVRDDKGWHSSAVAISGPFLTYYTATGIDACNAIHPLPEHTGLWRFSGVPSVMFGPTGTPEDFRVDGTTERVDFKQAAEHFKVDEDRIRTEIGKLFELQVEDAAGPAMKL